MCSSRGLDMGEEEFMRKAFFLSFLCRPVHWIMEVFCSFRIYQGQKFPRGGKVLRLAGDIQGISTEPV